MEILADTIDINEITDAFEHLMLSGITSNPSIIKMTKPVNFINTQEKSGES